MTKIKLCGLRREADIEYANQLLPDYIGFVFARSSKRYVSPEEALELRKKLSPEIIPVGVFVDEVPETIAEYVSRGIIDVVQLHGHEDNEYIKRLRELTSAPIIQAFKIACCEDVRRANNSAGDYVLLDSGSGSGEVFDHSLIKDIDRSFFLAGGLTPENVGEAVKKAAPYAVDASSALEINGQKVYNKMQAFIDAIRRKDE
ncbi:MAG: phosphoribosylanthranilate isomerase [Ruminococcus sp.]|nr:phosphoribosylanthranilate isomerase [Ruminococcus sp.]